MMEKHAKKGRLVYVSGKLQTRKWRKDGEDSERFEERFAELKETLAEQFAEAEELTALIQKKLEEVGAHG